jgi:sugar lactone lactonase YvrE
MAIHPGLISVARRPAALILLFVPALFFACSPDSTDTTSTANPLSVTDNAQALEDPPEFILKWGSFGSGDGEFQDPSGIDLDSEGNVYIGDHFNQRVQKFTRDGAFITKWSGNFTPWALAVERNDYVYVADNGGYRVLKFTADGTFLTQWGAPGSGDGEFYSPLGIAVANGYVYVTDEVLDRVQKFTTEGEFVTKWGTSGTGDGEFDVALGIDVDADGMVYVTDQLNGRVQKFTSDGDFVEVIVTSSLVANPVDVDVDQDGNIYVASSPAARMVKTDKYGEFLTSWNGSEVGGEPFRALTGVVADDIGNVYVTDFGNLVQKFGSFASVTCDIRPGTCPNPLNPRSRGVINVAVAGAADFDIDDIDAGSMSLAGALPIHVEVQDVTSPGSGAPGCPCDTDGADGYDDLVMKFRTEDLVGAFGDVSRSRIVSLAVRGSLQNGKPVKGSDCVLIVGRPPRGDGNGGEPPIDPVIGAIALFSDVEATSCTILDNEPNKLIQVYVVHTGTGCHTGAAFSAPIPPCMTGIFAADTCPPGMLCFGTSQTGIGIGYGGPIEGPVHILTINVIGLGLGGTCCEWQVLRDPHYDSVLIADCLYLEVPAVGKSAMVNPDRTCPCEPITDESDWPRIQALYGD